MGPANLPLGYGPKVERLGAVTDQDAIERSVQRTQRAFGTIRQYFEDRHAARGERPQRHRDAALVPRGAVGMFDIGGPLSVPRLVDTRLHGAANARLDGAERAERHAHTD